MNAPTETAYLKKLAENIPDEMKTYPAWVDWRYEERDGEITKVPYSPHTGRRAKTDDMRTWGTFEDAIDAYTEGDYAGIGYVCSSGDRYTGIDIDGAGRRADANSKTTPSVGFLPSLQGL